MLSHLIEILEQGESYTVEFKSRISHIAEELCAFSNSEGGNLVLGVDDSGKIVGINEKNPLQIISDKISAITPPISPEIHTYTIDKKKVILLSVKKSKTLHSVKNVVYIRVGRNKRPVSVLELLTMASESMLLDFDSSLTTLSTSILDNDYVNTFFRRRTDYRGVALPNNLHIALEQMGLIRNNCLTNAAILFFTKNPQELISNAVVRVLYFKDETMKEYYDSKFFTGPIWKITEEVEHYLLTMLSVVGGKVKGFRRESRLEYPMDALREVILNAIVHRNYFDNGEVTIFIFPDRLEISNPGSFPPGVMPDNPIHKPRNKQIAQLMYDFGFVEKYGSGIEKIKTICDSNGINVEFDLKPYSTKVIFRKMKTLPQSEKICALLSNFSEGMSSSELAKEIGVSKPTIVKIMKSLVSEGKVRPVGKGAAYRYVLSKP